MSNLNARITPFLWFDQNANEAVDFYLSVFKNSRRFDEFHSDQGHAAPGSPLTVSFELNGQPFVALNGGPMFKFTEAVSFAVYCENQEEIDYYWSRLTADGGLESQCGWLKDKFGLSWQIVPANIFELVRHPNAMNAMLQMRKLDIAALKRAAE
jgi:predicted 3-demethylubiquinone-9 3-methyltransferase (glyoxalase superfamily)